MQFDAIFKYNNVSANAQQIPDTNATADGIVGDILPTAFYYLPMVDDGTSKFRYWTRFIVAVPDMQGSREQNVWSRFQQIQCAGPDMKPPCTLVTAPLYWDTYWFATYPGANASDMQRETLRTGPVNASSARPARPNPSAPWSVRRALLIPQVNPGPRYRCGEST